MFCTELLDIFHLHWWVFFVRFIKASKTRAGIVYTIYNLLSRSRIDSKILCLSLILLSVVQFQLLVALTILDGFWVLKCVEPYSQWNGFFCCAKYVSLFSDIRIYSSHFLLLSFLDSVFLSLPYFLLLFFYSSCPFLCTFQCCLFFVPFIWQKSFLIVTVVLFSSSTIDILIYTLFMFTHISFPSSLSHSVLLFEGKSFD